MSPPSPGARRVSIGPLVLVVLAVAAAVTSCLLTLVRGVSDPGVAAAFVVAVAVGELLRVTLPGNRVQAPLALAGAFGYAFLFDLPSGPSVEPAAQIVAVASVGMLLGSIPHLAAGRAPGLDAVARRIVVVTVAAALARSIGGAVRDRAPDSPQLLVLALLGVATVAVLLDAVLVALLTLERRRTPLGAALRDELRAMLGLGAAVSATGLLVAQAAPVMGLWAIPVVSVPLVLTQVSLRRYAAVRATYRQTIRALSRVTEIGGYTPRGHAARVSQVAVAAGRDLGMREEELRDLEYAALLHDVGQLSLEDPVPGGSTLALPVQDQRRIASLGSAVIRQTGVLDRVARIVEASAEPHDGTATTPLCSQVVKAANAVDELSGGSAEPVRRSEALRSLHRTDGYDPEVLAALDRAVGSLERARVRG